MDALLLSWAISLITGAVGGNLGGTIFKNLSLGTVGNTIAGVVGGGIGGQIISAVLGGAGASGGSIVGNIAGSGVGSIVIMAVVGLIKNAMAKKASSHLTQGRRSPCVFLPTAALVRPPFAKRLADAGLVEIREYSNQFRVKP